ncbi:MAG: cation transporter, partial [Methanobrevibacter sp.]|nr:cation transporter [Methanobrevibacter sp.]
FEEVKGVYDLTLHNYGPTQLMGSVHVELRDDLTAKEIHKLTRQILYAVYEEFGIILTVGIYATNTDNEEAKEIKESLNEIIAKYPEILQMHGFYIDEDINLITFDLIVDFDADRSDVKDKVLEEIRNKYPKYQFDAILDADYSD